MVDEEKASGVNPLELIDTEIVAQEVIEKQLQLFTAIVIILQLMIKRKTEKESDKKVWKHLITKKRLNDESPKIKTKRKGIRKLMLNSQKGIKTEI